MKIKSVLIFIFVPLIMQLATFLFTVPVDEIQDMRQKVSTIFDAAKEPAMLNLEIKHLKKDLPVKTMQQEAEEVAQEGSPQQEKIKELEERYNKTYTKFMSYFDNVVTFKRSTTENLARNFRILAIVGTLLLVLVSLLLPYSSTRRALLASSLVVLFSAVPLVIAYIIALIILWITRKIYLDPIHTS
ncbi:hypothetical protein H0X48_06275 [Candidatus Dependentiae bacterium]|nr:hypothetical protein [Candidatus Dependentiae bacterium]